MQPRRADSRLHVRRTGHPSYGVLVAPAVGRTGSEREGQPGERVGDQLDVVVVVPDVESDAHAAGS
jgi:hypothetical protein